MEDITVGLRAPYDAPGGAAALARFAAQVETTGIDRVCVGDHVTFNGGRGFDGLLNATALAVLSRRITVQTAVYLLPLRHPVPVARQVSSLAALAPGRLSFGVGIGGEDPAELRACGIDLASRGRRMDEALTVLRPLLAGAEVTMSGNFFSLDGVRISPAPTPPVPIVIGGRSAAGPRGQQLAARHARMVRLRHLGGSGPVPARRGHGGLLSDSVQQVRAVLPVRDTGRDRRQPAAVRGRGLPVVQPDPAGGQRGAGDRGSGSGAPYFAARAVKAYRRRDQRGAAIGRER